MKTYLPSPITKEAAKPFYARKSLISYNSTPWIKVLSKALVTGRMTFSLRTKNRLSHFGAEEVIRTLVIITVILLLLLLTTTTIITIKIIKPSVWLALYNFESTFTYLILKTTQCGKQEKNYNSLFRREY